MVLILASICYEAYNNGKWLYIAKQIVLSKFYGCKSVSKKHHLRPLNDKYVDLIEGIEKERKEGLPERHSDQRPDDKIEQVF
jgi:hypothetical protein